MGKKGNDIKRFAISRNQRYLILEALYAELDRTKSAENPLPWHSERIRAIGGIINKIGFDNTEEY